MPSPKEIGALITIRRYGLVSCRMPVASWGFPWHSLVGFIHPPRMQEKGLHEGLCRNPWSLNNSVGDWNPKFKGRSSSYCFQRFMGSRWVFGCFVRADHMGFFNQNFLHYSHSRRSTSRSERCVLRSGNPSSKITLILDWVVFFFPEISWNFPRFC